MADSPQSSSRFKIPSSTMFISAHKFIRKGEKSKLIQSFSYMLAFFLYLLLQIFQLFLYRFTILRSSTGVLSQRHPSLKPAASYGDSGIARALSQILATINEIPVSSRKYELLQNLAEKLIEENMREGNGKLKEINRSVISAGFGRTIGLLESNLLKRVEGTCERLLSRFFRMIPSYFHGDRLNTDNEVNRDVGSAEKLGVELLWLAQKLAASGAADEAVRRWCAASSLAWFSLTADPRVQGSLVRVSAFLLKKMRECDEEKREKEEEEGKSKMGHRERMKMLTLWLPLLCHASNGVDAPVLSSSERAEVERNLEDAIEKLDIDCQEKVLALWLQHFTSSPTDWPNLQTCYIRWWSVGEEVLGETGEDKASYSLDRYACTTGMVIVDGY